VIDFRNRIQPDWPTVLEDVLARARALQSAGVVAFDLDSTLLDNRPRQARIVREFGGARGVAVLTQCRASHFDSGWNVKVALGRCGLDPAHIERLYPDFKRFWEARFFTSAYCLEDIAVRGAPEFVRTLLSTSVHVCYVTGRHEGMRPGTEESMRREALPLGSPNVTFMMKPVQTLDDDAFKRDAHRQLAKMGTLIAAFDNEPIHANDYRETFPDAVIVHLATDHSGRSANLSEGVRSIPHFQRPT
jgi:hypothetical protein